MTRRARRIVLIAAVLPLVVLVGLRAAWAAYACQVDGKVRSACCCPQKAEPLDDSLRIERRSCCDVSVGEAAPAPDVRESERPRTVDVPLVLVERAEPLLSPIRVRSTRTIVEHARPPPRVPLYLAIRTILC